MNLYPNKLSGAFSLDSFGMLMRERTFSLNSYGYGFNGKEKIDEINGEGNEIDFGARIYDSRLGSWMSLDPLQEKYPSLSPYNFCGNNPIMFVDPDGQRIDLSNLSRSQRREYKAQIRQLKKSDIFKQLYKELQENKDFVVTIKLTATERDGGSFFPGGKGGVATVNPELAATIVQELFAAYQVLNMFKGLTDGATQTDLEAEQEIAAHFIINQAKDNGGQGLIEYLPKGAIDVDEGKVTTEPIIDTKYEPSPNTEEINSCEFDEAYQNYKPKFKEASSHLYDLINANRPEKDKKAPPSNYTGPITKARPRSLIHLVQESEKGKQKNTKSKNEKV